MGRPCERMHAENFRALAMACCTIACEGPVPFPGSKYSQTLSADRYCGPLVALAWFQPTVCCMALFTICGSGKVGSPWLRIQPV